jgi:alginate export protein
MRTTIGRRVLAVAVLATVGGAMVAAGPAYAKVDVDNLTIGGEVRIRYEIRNNTSLNSNGAGNESAAQHRIRVNVGYDLTPDVSFFAQIQDVRIYGSEGPFGAGAAAQSGIFAVSSQNQNGTGLDLHQGYILVKNLGLPGLSLKVGRQEILYGDQRLVGNFGWSMVGNSFDAAKLMYSTPLVDVDLFWARIFDNELAAGCTAGAGNNCTGIIFPGNTAKGTQDQNFYGTYVTLKVVPNWTIEPYYFLLQDTRPVVAGNFATVPQAADQTRSTLGARINGRQGIAGGALDATGELAWQFGGMASGAAGQNHDLHINAWAGAFRAGYTFEPVPMRPRVGIEIDYGSGSNCKAACGKNNTFDNLFPTNHFKFGAMDLGSWKNMVTYQAVFDVKPDAVSKVQVNFAILRLANHLDNWYRAAQVVYGVTNPANTSSSLGRELDVHYYRTIKEKFKFEIGAGHFWAGSYLNPANGNNINVGGAGASNGSGQNWGYVMGSVLF